MALPMSDELNECAAAFFRIKGKDVVTPKEFAMSVTLDLKWMSAKEAEALKRVLLDGGAIVQSNGYLKPAADFSALRVPVAYRPTEGVRKLVAERLAKGKAPPARKRPAAPQKSADMFPEMVDIAARIEGPDKKPLWNKGKFIGECNKLRKSLGVNTSVAALLLLRDSGEDVVKDGLADRVYAQSAVKP